MMDILFGLIVVGGLICALTGAALLVRDAEVRHKHRKRLKKAKQQANED